MAEMEKIFQTPTILQHPNHEGVLLQSEKHIPKEVGSFVRGILVHYSKKKINTVLGGKNVEDSNHSLFEKMDDMNLDMVRKSLCLPGTAWLNKKFFVDKISRHRRL